MNCVSVCNWRHHIASSNSQIEIYVLISSFGGNGIVHRPNVAQVEWKRTFLSGERRRFPYIIAYKMPLIDVINTSSIVTTEIYY